MLQNATPLRKSAPGPPNISDEHVSCIAPATENASCQILFKRPLAAVVLEMPQNPQILLTFDKVQNPVRLPRKTTSERPKVFRTRQPLTLLTSKCALRHNGVHFFDIVTSKSAPKLVCFVHFDLEMCFPPQRHALFIISTSKSCPNLVCSAHFDLDMCFAPHRRALFQHDNFQKWSDVVVFCTF